MQTMGLLLIVPFFNKEQDGVSYGWYGLSDD